MVTQEEATTLAKLKLQELISGCQPQTKIDVMNIACSMLDHVTALLIASSGKDTAALVVVEALKEILELEEPRAELASAVARAAHAAGGQSALARKIDVTPQAVQQWCATGKIPAERVLQVEEASGIPRYVLRPDLYPKTKH